MHGLLIAVASLIVEHRLSSAGSVVVVHGISDSTACGVLLDQGIKPASPTLASGLPTTGSPGKSILGYPKHPVLTAFWAPYCINSFFLACIVCIVKAMVFPVATYRWESWTKKRLSAEEPMLSNCDAGEDSWESHGQQGDQTSPKGNQPLVFTGRTDAKAEAPILGPSDVKNWLIGKDCDAGKCWREEEKGMTEDEMVGWHHQLNGHQFEQALGVGDGQGNLACCSPWDCKESDTTEWLNWLSDTNLCIPELF